jgi:hypothetical protein
LIYLDLLQLLHDKNISIFWRRPALAMRIFSCSWVMVVQFILHREIYIDLYCPCYSIRGQRFKIAEIAEGFDASSGVALGRCRCYSTSFPFTVVMDRGTRCHSYNVVVIIMSFVCDWFFHPRQEVKSGTYRF